MKLIFLGTSGSIPTPSRGLSSMALKREGELLLFDCSEGTQRQMTRAGLSPLKVDAIFLTHFHGDHFLGVPGLVQTMALMKRERDLDIYGPPETRKRIKKLLSIPLFTLTYNVNIHDVNPGEEIKRNGYTIKTCKTDHSVPGLAYALVEDERPGKFDEKKAKKLGVKKGPDFSRLQKGKKVKVNGKVVKPEDVMGPKRPGRKIVYSPDTRPCTRVINLAKNADVLVHEATFANDLEEKAHNNFHSTPKQAAEVAKKAGVKKLFMIHVSTRYKKCSTLEAQARKIFPESVVPEDLTEFEVKNR